MDAEIVRALLPWGHPFLMVDAMQECVPHERVVTVKRVCATDPMVVGHEPDSAAFPSSMVLEGLSQSAALLFQLSYGPIEASRVPMLGYLEATVGPPARPGDTITYVVHAVKMTSVSGIFRGVATIEGATIAQAQLAFAVPASAEAGNGC